MAHVFIERLTLRRWLLSVVPFLVRQNKVDLRVFYIDAEPLALEIARLLTKVLGASLERLDFRMADMQDENGIAVRLRLTSQELGRLQDDIMRQPEFQAWLRTHSDPRPRLESFLAKSVVARIPEERFDLWMAIYVIWVCRRRASRDGGTSAVLFMEHRPWFSALEHYASRLDVRLIPVLWLPSAREFLRSRLDEKIIGLVRIVRAHGVRGLKRWLSDDKAAIPDDARPRLAVEYYGHLNLGDTTRPSNLFFWQKSTALGRDILIMFGLFKDRLTRERLKEIRRHGLDAIAVHPAAAADLSVPLFFPRDRLDTKFPMIRDLKGARKEISWLIKRTSDYDSRRAFWTDLFERTGVKVFLSWYKNDPVHCAIADALEQLGGVTALYQRSLELTPNPSLSIDADVHFAFSRSAADLARRNRSRIRYNIVTGYFSDYLFSTLRPKAKELRGSLLDRGAKFIVAVFDEYSLPDDRWTPGHELQRANYRLMCEKVLMEPWLGVIFKPKSPKDLRRRLGPELADLLSRAQATGRCVLLENSDFLSEQLPAEAAMASDIAVHGHVSAGTAGMEAAMAGVPSLLVDPEGWSESPLYRLGIGRVVFKDWETLWDTLSREWKKSGSVPGLGDWSPLLDELDPFRDGKAAERIGEYLGWILQALKLGCDREEAMSAASQRYAERWGQDKVTQIHRPAL